MSRRMTRPLIATSAIALFGVMAVINAQNKASNVNSPSQENPVETIRKLSSNVKAASPAQSAQTRCLAKQQARLDQCASKAGREREVCEAVAKELIAVCNQMNPEESNAASALFCKQTCAVRQCPNGCPAPGGRTCDIGSVCATEGAASDPNGILLDCQCTTSVVKLPNFPRMCSCASQ